MKSNTPTSRPFAGSVAVTGSRVRILIVGDDTNMSRFLQSHLARGNFEVSSAISSEEAIRALRAFDPNVVALDISPHGMGGLQLLERIRPIKPDAGIIILCSQNDPELIFQASKLGADEYLAKPFDTGEFDLRIARILEKARGVSDRGRKLEPLGHTDFAMMFGTSPKMEEVKMTIEKVADTNAIVLIRGESGTGKEVVARMVYAKSARRDKPFVKVNCAAIPYELLESELFGYEPGAFTGANRQKLGKFDLANNGTLFLDEISEMHPALQAKLLHVLQDGEFARLGGKRDIAVDVRVLAATNKPLERAVAEGAFREDLFYRLNVVTIHIPPLRDRREEIPIFLEFFLNKYSEYYGKHPAPFSDYAVNMMMRYDWPGNIRELENLVKRYTIVGNESQIIHELATHKPIISSISPPAVETTQNTPARNETNSTKSALPAWNEQNGLSLLQISKLAAMRAEREAIERVLTQTRWNRRRAAKILKISYKALLNKLKLIEGNFESTSEKLSAL